MKYMSIEEFKERGYLQEANRLFFHPLGLALEVSIDNDSGDIKLSGVQDNRDDPEGMIFGDYDREKADRIWGEMLSKVDARVALGCCTVIGVQVGNYTEEEGKATKDEFEKGYADRSGVTVGWLHQQGQGAVPCSCGEDDCKGWAMVNLADHIKHEEVMGAFFGDETKQ